MSFLQMSTVLKKKKDGKTKELKKCLVAVFSKCRVQSVHAIAGGCHEKPRTGLQVSFSCGPDTSLETQ